MKKHCKIKENKLKLTTFGFTLIELLAIIIVLGFIMMLIVPKITDLYNDSKKNIGYESTDRLVKTFEEYYVRMRIKDNTPSCLYNFNSDVTDCIDFSFDGKKPVTGEIVLSDDGSINGYVVFDKYMYLIDNGIVSTGDLYDYNIGTEYVFDYTEDEQIFTVLFTGNYKLEVWGAQGGSYNETYHGGYGGYSVGTIYLNKGTNLFINIGGQGNLSHNSIGVSSGGYNGGGDSDINSDGLHYTSSGGGATHIATKSGLLSTFSSDISSILIVSGGGGGSYYHTWGYYGSGGSAGGFQGSQGQGSRTVGSLGGSQTSGGIGVSNGSFGLGGSSNNGGGAGYYGGGASNGNIQDYGLSGAGGGSSYIGNDLLTDKAMYCYNCTESDIQSTYTVSTTGTSSLIDSINCSLGYNLSPVSRCAKAGDGYVKITYLGN